MQYISFAVVKDPPFRLEESGYGCFHLPVQVHFKNKEEPKKVDFDYDLLLPGLGQPPVSNIRSEALTFKNPTDEFKRKVLKAGGVIISNANGCNRLGMLSSFSPKLTQFSIFRGRYSGTSVCWKLTCNGLVSSPG